MSFEIPNPHNACFKDFFKDPEFVKAFIKYHIPEEICSLLDLDTLQVDLSGFVSQEHREYYADDVMVTVQIKGHTENVNIYILLEFTRLNRPEVYGFAVFNRARKHSRVSDQASDSELRSAEVDGSKKKRSASRILACDHPGGYIPWKGQVEIQPQVLRPVRFAI